MRFEYLCCWYKSPVEVEGGQTSGRHSMAQEIFLWDGKDALLKVYHQPSSLEMAENFFHVPLVLLHGGAGNDDFGQVYESDLQIQPAPGP